MKDKLKLIESNKLMNGRLIISVISILVALYALLYDWYDLFWFKIFQSCCTVVTYQIYTVVDERFFEMFLQPIKITLNIRLYRLYPFPASRFVLIICVLTYFALMGLLTLYLFFVESGIFFVGIVRDKAGLDPDSQLYISSTLKRFACSNFPHKK